MSIATIESQKITKSDMKRYYRVDYITIAPEYALAMCRYAYIAGRTAGPTGAEIEAAAHRLYEVTHAPEADPGWYAISKIKRETYCEQAAMMLEAARKAVMA